VQASPGGESAADGSVERPAEQGAGHTEVSHSGRFHNSSYIQNVLYTKLFA